MKKIIFTLLVAVMFLATAEAKPVKKAVPKKETTQQTVENNADEQAYEPASDPETWEDATDKVNITKDGVIVKDEDGNSVKVKISDLGRIISKHLDDTLISADDLTVDNVATTQADEDRETVKERLYNERSFAQEGMNLARDITEYLAIAIVWVVALTLLFYYLHRRRKYKTIDRAIQAGYQLPDEFYGKHSARMPQQPANVYVNQIIQPTDDMTQNGAASPAGMPLQNNHSGNPLKNITDWAPFRNGFITTAVGLGLMFFFWIAGGTPIAALMMIVVFIGLGKLFIAYQEQQNLKNYWQNQQWSQQPQQGQSQTQQGAAQPAQQQWQQWSQPQQGEEMPPMPETPPHFNQDA